MRDAAAARWVARAWALLAACSAFYFLADNEADNDLWMHLFTGRVILASGAAPRIDDLSYTAAGLPWVDHEWLAQAGMAWLFESAGSSGLWFCKLAVALLTAWLLWRSVARRTSSWWVRGPVLVMAFATLARGYAIRPQIVTYFAVAALLWWLDRLDLQRRAPRPWTLLTGVAFAFALWANLHGGFILGFAILALYALLPGRHDTPDAAAVPRWLGPAMLGVALLAACATPYGPGLFTYIAAELLVPHPLTEWQPVHPGDLGHLPFITLLVVWAVTLPFAQTMRRQPWRAALVAGIAVMALRHQRHAPLLALCAAAPLAEQLDGMLAWLRDRTAFRLSAASQGIVAVAVALLAVGQIARVGDRLWQTRARVVYLADDYPVGALAFLRRSATRGNLALPLDWGGYALWHVAPDVRVSLDGRFATVYPPAVVEDNFAFFRGDGGAGSPRLLEAYDTQLVLVPRGVATPLDGRPDWHPLYGDAVATLFARRDSSAGTGEAPRGWLEFP